MIGLLCRALAAYGIFTLVSAAQAGTLNYTGYAVLNNQNVLLQVPTLHVNEWAGSGEIILYTDQVSDGALGTWCVDIPDTLQNAGTFSTGKVLGGTFGNTVNALLSNVVPLLDGSPYVSSALQVAIWQAEYGDALQVTASSQVSTLAAMYLQNVANGTFVADPHREVALLTADGKNQDQAYLTAVPEPSSMLLVGAGLVGLGLIRRRVSRTS